MRWSDIPREEILHYPVGAGSAPCVYCGNDCAEQCLEIVVGVRSGYGHVSCYLARVNRGERPSEPARAEDGTDSASASPPSPSSHTTLPDPDAKHVPWFAGMPFVYRPISAHADDSPSPPPHRAD